MTKSPSLNNLIGLRVNQLGPSAVVALVQDTFKGDPGAFARKAHGALKSSYLSSPPLAAQVVDLKVAERVKHPQSHKEGHKHKRHKSSKHSKKSERSLWNSFSKSLHIYDAQFSSIVFSTNP